MVLDELTLYVPYRCGTGRPVFGPLPVQQVVERLIVGAERILPPVVGCVPRVKKRPEEIRVTLERETVDVELELVVQEN